MPLATVEMVVIEGGLVPRGLARAIADAVGRTLGSPPGQTWVRLRTLDFDRYAENESAPDPAQLPVFVTILKREVREGAALEAEAQALTRAIAIAVGRPADCIHVEFAPAAAGRQAFGGTLVR
jgi:phenylpyruvate tautomerase PptA (4-oxalocrotonate tautomerase family)